MSDRKDRVLGRRGARQLSPEEVRFVCGTLGIRTATLCSFNPATKATDGDINEC